MESTKNRNPFYYVGAFAASAALFFGGVTYGKYNDADQLHNAAVVLHHQGGQANKQLAEQAQLYSNQSQSDIKEGLAAAAVFGGIALGSFMVGAATAVDRKRQAGATIAEEARPKTEISGTPELLAAPEQ